MSEPTRITPVYYEFESHIARAQGVWAGLIEPTPEEQAQIDANRAAYREEQELRESQEAVLVSELMNTQNVMTQEILQLHSRSKRGTCEGCDQGCNCDSPTWPCSTVVRLAELHDIHIPFTIW